MPYCTLHHIEYFYTSFPLELSQPFASFIYEKLTERRNRPFLELSSRAGPSYISKGAVHTNFIGTEMSLYVENLIYF